MKVGDVVPMAEDSAPRGFWPLAHVEKVVKGRDDRVRSADLRTASGAVYCHPVKKICPLEEADDYYY